MVELHKEVYYYYAPIHDLGVGRGGDGVRLTRYSRAPPYPGSAAHETRSKKKTETLTANSLLRRFGSGARCGRLGSRGTDKRACGRGELLACSSGAAFERPVVARASCGLADPGR